MPQWDVPQSIAEGLTRLFDLPVLGQVTQEIWAGTGLASFEPVFSGLVNKALLSSQDNQVHSFMLLMPMDEQFTMVFTGLTWPHALSEVRAEAREQFFKSVAMFLEQEEFAGLLQLDVFLESSKTEVRLAWLPFPKALERLPAPLQRSLLPWGSEPFTVKEAKAPVVGGKEIVTLAERSRVLLIAMAALLREWRDEGQSPSILFGAARDQCMAAVSDFNDAVKLVGLPQAMPVSKFDDTWLPHNLNNALRYRSLVSSLNADLLRVLGTAARDRFVEAWDVFERAQPNQPAEESLRPLRETPLLLRLEVAPPVVPHAVDVFISYAWSDKTRGARDLYESVKAAHYSAWIDEEERLDENQLNDQVAAAIVNSNRIVICLSTEMLTRGGYALREVLLALSHAAPRCLLARLDRVPLPAPLANIPYVNWFEPGGPEKLLGAIQKTVDAGSSANVRPETMVLKGPLIDALIASLIRPAMLHRQFNTPNRLRSLILRAELFRTMYKALELDDNRDWGAINELAANSPEIMQWSALAGPNSRVDPTVFGASLRLRSAVFRAHVQLGAGKDHVSQNRRAFQVLEEILEADQTLLLPAPEFGWIVDESRISHQLCLDVFDFAKEWFRGFSPATLVAMSEVPRELANTIEDRIAARIALLGERMLALRATEDTHALTLAPSWPDLRFSVRGELGAKLRGGSHPVTQAFFQELSRVLSESILDQLDIAIADNGVESYFTDHSREELFFDLPTFRLRCVISAHKAFRNRQASLAAVRGTIFDELRGKGSEDADLSIVLTLLVGFDQDTWNYDLLMNIAPSADAERTSHLPEILLNPFLVGQMLNQDEIDRILPDGSLPIYEEL